MSQLRGDGHVRLGADGWQLSQSGIDLARRDGRNQALWNVYRLHAHELNLPIVAEERYVDIASRLPAAAIAELERRLPGSAGG